MSSLARGRVSEDVGQDVLKKCQKALQEPLDEKRFETLKTASAGNDRDRLEAVRRPHASAWITSFPSKALGLKLPPQEFRVSCRSWLGFTSRQEAHGSGPILLEAIVSGNERIALMLTEGTCTCIDTSMHV